MWAEAVPRQQPGTVARTLCRTSIARRPGGPSYLCIIGVMAPALAADAGGRADNCGRSDRRRWRVGGTDEAWVTGNGSIWRDVWSDKAGCGVIEELAS